MMFFSSLTSYALLALGLGFVVFFHELGHFLAAKYSDVLVEQFAVGFGPAIIAWRKGIGLRRGTTTPEMDRRIDEHLQAAGKKKDEDPTRAQIERARRELHLGETEYRLNWVFLGGYVKMLGQDDMDPANLSEDPRSYNKKPIRLRMLIISAGVLMNVLLAAIGFMIVFLVGFKDAPAVIGGVLNNSPASFTTRDDGTRRPLAVGDRIVSFNGHEQHGFGSVRLTVLLAHEGDSLPMVVRHVDGSQETLHVTPVKETPDAPVLAIGVLPPSELRGPEKTQEIDPEYSDPNFCSDDFRAIKRGDIITAINGVPTPAVAQDSAPSQASGQTWRLQQALNNQDTGPVELTIRGDDGATRTVQIHRHFQTMFGRTDLDIAGMTPRVRVDQLADKDAPAYGVIKPQDVILAIAIAGGEEVQNPSPQKLRDLLNAAGQDNKTAVLTLLSPDGSIRQTKPITPNFRIDDDHRGLGIAMAYDDNRAVIGEVAPDSAAARAGIQPGWTLTKIDGQDAENFFHIRRAIAAAQPGKPLALEAQTPKGPVTVRMTLSADEIESAGFLTVTSDAWFMLRDLTEIRKTDNPITAARWGLAETRENILQFYVTLQRMVERTVSYKEVMGPVGIVKIGAATAAHGFGDLVSFLSMISVNLAVVNFLPVPIMDGGLFVLLIFESIRGRPLPMKTQQAIQMVGLAMILTLFLLVTYQDITRHIGHG